MNKENAINKINNYGKAGKIITIIMMVVVSLSLIATIMGSIGLMVMPEDIMTLNIGTQAELILNPSAIDPDFDAATLDMMDAAFETGSAGLNLGVVRMELDSAEIVGNTLVARTNGEIGSVSLRSLGQAVLMAAAALVLTLVSVIFACRLCMAFEKCQSPFEDMVINRMRTFAWSLLPWAVFSSLAESVVAKIFSNNVKIGISLNTNIIFAVLIILALTIVFKYGAILQQESDETL